MADAPSSKPLLDKLGIQPGMSVAVLGVDDPSFLTNLRKRVGDFASEATSDHDAILVAIDAPEDLVQMAALKQAITRDGMVWAVYCKGQPGLNRNDVLQGGLAAGLVDVKIASFSETHSASKFVIRKAER